MSSEASPLSEASGEEVAAVLSQVRELLVEVIGEDYLVDVEIDMDTSFENDLELESIEFVALSERMQEYYPHIDFVEWVADMELHEILGLRVGRLVTFIAQSQP